MKLNKYNIKCSGFTLLELLMAILVMVIALFALSVLKNVALQNAISAQRIMEATVCAEQAMEMSISEGYNVKSTANPQACDSNSRYTWIRLVNPNVDEDLELKKIYIKVTWEKSSVEIQTLLSNI